MPINSFICRIIMYWVACPLFVLLSDFSLYIYISVCVSVGLFNDRSGFKGENADRMYSLPSHFGIITKFICEVFPKMQLISYSLTSQLYSAPQH